MPRVCNSGRRSMAWVWAVSFSETEVIPHCNRLCHVQPVNPPIIVALHPHNPKSTKVISA